MHQSDVHKKPIHVTVQSTMVHIYIFAHDAQHATISTNTQTTTRGQISHIHTPQGPALSRYEIRDSIPQHTHISLSVTVVRMYVL